MTGQRHQSLALKSLRISVCMPLLACTVGLTAHALKAEDAKSEAAPPTPVMVRHVMQKSSLPPVPAEHRAEFKPRMAAPKNLASVNTGPGVVFTCDSTVATSTCNYLNTTVAGFYNSVFTNANGNVYIQYGTTSLGESLTIDNFVTYSKYVAALSANPSPATFQTDAVTALNTYDAGPYGSGNVKVSSALGRALSLPGMQGVNQQETALCTAGAAGCFDVVITVTNDPSTPLYYDDQGGTEPSDAYDYYAVVMHEVDEMLGTSSCINTGNNTLKDGCDNINGSGTGVPSAVDLFRYTAPGTLALASAPSEAYGANGQYFSFDGGTDYGVGGDADTFKVYNTIANGEDFADFSHTNPADCSVNEAIQDAEGCPGADGGLTVLNDGAAELTILATVGYQLPGATAPAHSTLTYPTPSSTLPGPSATFKWSAVSGSQGYWLFLGTTGKGSKNLYDSNQTAATSVTVLGILPTDGVTIYARIYTKLNGTLYYNDYTYTAAIKPPVILSPAPGSTLTSTTEKFTWNAAGGQGYWLFVGTTGAGSKNIIDTGEQSATSATVSNLPSNGEKLYVRVYNRVNGTLYYNDYTYKSK